jgi:hypothetical protein
MEHVAIDLGSRQSQVCIRDAQGQILMERRQRTDLLGTLLSRRGPSRVVLETCSEAFAVADAAMAAGHEVRVVPATLVPLPRRGSAGSEDRPTRCTGAQRGQLSDRPALGAHPQGAQPRDALDLHLARGVDRRAYSTHQLCPQLSAYAPGPHPTRLDRDAARTGAPPSRQQPCAATGAHRGIAANHRDGHDPDPCARQAGQRARAEQPDLQTPDDHSRCRTGDCRALRRGRRTHRPLRDLRRSRLVPGARPRREQQRQQAASHGHHQGRLIGSASRAGAGRLGLLAGQPVVASAKDGSAAYRPTWYSVSPKRALSTCMRLKYRPTSCSSVTPMPPWSWMPWRHHESAGGELRLGRAHRAAARGVVVVVRRPWRPGDRLSSSTSTNMSTARCCSAWKVPILTPNCSRVLRYSTVMSSTVWAMPRPSAHRGRRQVHGAAQRGAALPSSPAAPRPTSPLERTKAARWPSMVRTGDREALGVLSTTKSAELRRGRLGRHHQVIGAVAVEHPDLLARSST